MQAQDTTTLYLLKLWPWIEANKNRLIGGAVIIAAAIFIYSFFSYQTRTKGNRRGAGAGATVRHPGRSHGRSVPEDCREYPGTAAGQRALLQGAAALFEAGKYPEAQAQFQKFLDSHPGSELAGQAALGVATSLDAQGKPAATEFQAVVNNYSDPAIVSAAKFALGRIAESQGKLNEAFACFEDAARLNPGSTLGYEAGMHVLELRNKVSTTTPAPAPAPAPAPFTLTPAKPGN